MDRLLFTAGVSMFDLQLVVNTTINQDMIYVPKYLQCPAQPLADLHVQPGLAWPSSGLALATES